MPTVPDLHRKKKTGMERSGPTPSAFSQASWPCGSGTGGGPTAAAERHHCQTTAGHMNVLVCISLLSTPLAANFGPGPEGSLEGCAAGRGVSSLLSTPLAADFGPGPEEAAGGRTGGRRCFFQLPSLWPPTSGLARRRRRRGAQLDGEFAFNASRHQLRAWPGWGGGGARSWTGRLNLWLLLANPTRLQGSDAQRRQKSVGVIRHQSLVFSHKS